MRESQNFLFVDDDEDHRFCLAVAMLRTFPTSLICECADSELAIMTSRRLALSAAVIHSAADISGISLVERLRNEHPDLTIVLVAPNGQSRASGLHAGATAVLDDDSCDDIGPLVEDMLSLQ